jgi:hypothetical protein
VTLKEVADKYRLEANNTDYNPTSLEIVEAFVADPEFTLPARIEALADKFEEETFGDSWAVQSTGAEFAHRLREELK